MCVRLLMDLKCASLPGSDLAALRTFKNVYCGLCYCCQHHPVRSGAEHAECMMVGSDHRRLAMGCEQLAVMHCTGCMLGRCLMAKPVCIKTLADPLI